MTMTVEEAFADYVILSKHTVDMRTDKVTLLQICAVFSCHIATLTARIAELEAELSDLRVFKAIHGVGKIESVALGDFLNTNELPTPPGEQP